MARRSSRRSRAASPNAPKEKGEFEDLETFLQNLKVIEIKRRSIQRASNRIPFIWCAVVLTGLLLVPFLLSLSILGIFIFGAIFMATLAQLFGPTGAITRRKDARAHVQKMIAECSALLPKVMRQKPMVMFSMVGLTRKDIFVSELHTLDEKMFNGISSDGVFPIGKYRYLGVAFRATDGQIDFQDPKLNIFEWSGRTRAYGVPKANITNSLKSAALR